MLRKLLVCFLFIVSSSVFAKDVTPTHSNALQNFDFVANEFNNHINMSTLTAKKGTEIAIATSDTMDIVVPLDTNSQDFTITQCVKNGNNNPVGYYLKIKKNCVINLVFRHLHQLGSQGRVTVGVMAQVVKNEEQKQQVSDVDDVFMDLSIIRKCIKEFGKVSSNLANQAIKSIHQDVLKPFNHSNFAKKTKHESKKVLKTISKESSKVGNNTRKTFNKLTRGYKFKW